MENQAKEINLQIWDKLKYPNAKYWSDIPVEKIRSYYPDELAQAIADTGYSVRMTYPFGGITDVSRLNGMYYVPKIK